jgi:hypothetical protein
MAGQTRPDRRHAGSGARPADVALAGTAKASRRKEPLAPAGVIGRDDAGCIAARAVDVQLKAVAGDIADCLERKFAKHASDLGRSHLESSGFIDRKRCGMRTRYSASTLGSRACSAPTSDERDARDRHCIHIAETLDPA